MFRSVIVLSVLVTSCTTMKKASNTYAPSVTELEIQAYEHLEAGRFTEAGAAVNKALTINKNYYGARVARATVRSVTGDYAGAFSDINRAINSNRGKAPAYAARGLIFRRVGRYDEAINDFTKAIDLEKMWPNYYMMRGYTYFCEGQTVAACEDFEAAAKLRPEYYPAYSAIARAHMFQGDYKLALHILDQILDREPENIEALVIKSETLVRLGRKAEATQILKKQLSRPNDKLTEGERRFLEEQLKELGESVETTRT